MTHDEEKAKPSLKFSFTRDATDALFFVLEIGKNDYRDPNPIRSEADVRDAFSHALDWMIAQKLAPETINASSKQSFYDSKIHPLVSDFQQQISFSASSENLGQFLEKSPLSPLPDYSAEHPTTRTSSITRIGDYLEPYKRPSNEK